MANLDTTAWFIPVGGYANLPGSPYADSPGLGVSAAEVDLNAGLLELKAIYAPTSYPGYVGMEGPVTLPLAGGMVMWATASMLYGTVEARVKLMGVGAHTAFWLYDINARPYVYQNLGPAIGQERNEIDIAEGLPFIYSNTTTLRQNTFAVGGSHINTTTVTDYSANFHIYKVVWTPTSVTWFVDGVQTNQTTTNIPSHRMMVMLDIEAADAGAGDVVAGNFPQTMQVDYVHAWDISGNLIFSDEFDGTPAFQNCGVEAFSQFLAVESPLSSGGNFTAIADTNFGQALKVITGNVVEPAAATSIAGVFWSGATIGSSPLTDDQYSELNVNAQTSNGTSYLIVRQGAASSGTQYLAAITTIGWALQANITGTSHALASGSSTLANGDVWRLSVLGNVLTLTQNAAVIKRFVDTNSYVLSGQPGFGLSGTSAITDAQAALWAGGNSNVGMIQVFSYNFSTQENPLSDSGNFTIVSDAVFTGSLKTIIGNVTTPTTNNAVGAAFFSGTVAAPSGTWPADQYSEITLTLFVTTADLAYIFVRQGVAASGTQYVARLDFSAQQWTLFAIVAGVVHTLVAASPQACAQGDVFRLTIVGNVLTLNRNGSQVQTFTDTNNYIAGGSPGFGLFASIASNIQTGLVAFGANQAATPTFSPGAGTYIGTQTVTITSASGGTIYYTTDGTAPTHSSSSITSGLTISVAATETVKAIASVANNVDSPVGTAAFTITTLAPFSSGTGRNIVDAGDSFATQIRSPRTAIIGTNLRTRII